MKQFNIFIPFAAVGGLLAFALSILFMSSVITVTSDEIIVVSKRYGRELPPGQIVARTPAEKGPQAGILGPGVHFFYWPWAFEIRKAPVLAIPSGSLGIVTAVDGKALPEGRIFAPRWSDPQQMLDAAAFLESGFRGPQETVLAPAKYRYNPMLFKIDTVPATVIREGEVGVIIGMDGENARPDEFGLVRKGQKGIWDEPLSQGTYYLHPQLYRVVRVKTTQRTYTYQKVDRDGLKYDDSIPVKSLDGFHFPVDVRLGVRVDSVMAPRLVALLGTPDEVIKDSQEGDELEVLEARLILPPVRSNTRDLAEKNTALDFLNKRTEVEDSLRNNLRPIFATNFITLNEIYIGNVGLDDTRQGQALLETLTNKRIAEEQKAMFAQQVLAAEEQQKLVEAQTRAREEQKIVESQIAIKVEENRAQARAAEAKGESEAIRQLGNARKEAFAALAQALGADGATTLEIMRLVAENKIDITPQVMVNGSGTGTTDALMGTLLGERTPSKP